MHVASAAEARKSMHAATARPFTAKQPRARPAPIEPVDYDERGRLPAREKVWPASGHQGQYHSKIEVFHYYGYRRW